MEQQTALSPDDVFGLLIDRRRRYVLHYLRLTESDVVEFEPLIAWVVDHLEPSDSSEECRERLETSLHHVHLPRLASSGVVDYDWRSQTIRYRRCDALERHLELAADDDLS